ncbi:MAG TPA: diacylglycerol kinase family protein [Planctomycetota bacterium]|nr:diacylglycerol kinase family protein [Planctomycetota bacterium]
MLDRVKIIVNPASGRGRALKLAEEVAGLLRGQGCAVDLQQTTAIGDARRLARESEDCGAVAATGGDGTVNEVLNGLPLGAQAPALAMLPSGTANVLAKELKLPQKPAELAGVIREGKASLWDLGVDRSGGRRFLLFASAGYDAHVVHLFHAERRGPIHMWQYLYWGMKSVFDYEAPRITVEIDGGPPEEAAWVLVSQVPTYGGPLVFTPDARPGRGTFEVMIQRGRGRWDLVGMFWSAFLAHLFGRRCRRDDVRYVAARRVRLSSADGKPVPVQMDGDPGGHLPAEWEIVPGGVRVVTP